jgi:hypothetical protein
MTTAAESRPWKVNPERYAHGTRSRYVSGCRCDECRAANTRRYHERQAVLKELAADVTPIVTPHGNRCRGVDRDGDGIPEACFTRLTKASKGGLCGGCREFLSGGSLVPAGRVRRRLRTLSKRGIGYKTAADACGASRTIFAGILNGTRKRVRRSVELKILALDEDAMADGAHVDAKPTWRLIDSLVRRGWSKAELARRLGRKREAIQFRTSRVTVRTAHDVEVLYRKLRDEKPVRGKAWASRPCTHARPLEIVRDGKTFCARCSREVRSESPSPPTAPPPASEERHPT